MVTWNIIQRDGNEDTFGIVEDAANQVMLIPALEPDTEVKTISHDIIKKFTKNKLLLTNVRREVINLGLAVYTSDQLVARNRHGYDAWSRSFKLYLPVQDLSKWEAIKENLAEMLSFLSGDHWELYFRQSERGEVQFPDQGTLEFSRINAVTLFSGGLDSFIGASDLLKDNKNIALVGHHKSQGYENKTQQALTITLQKQYPGRTIESFFFFAQPNQRANIGGKERSSRARSILFITLGLTVANAYGEDVPLYIPENGLISLNVPLTNTRMGSSSTRTTHPYFLSLIREMAVALGMKNEIINPYKYLTKGEMINKSKDLAFVKAQAQNTISCAKPGYHKQWHKSFELHCGYCTPCLIRRAAMKAGGIDDPQNYVYKVDREIPDYKEDIGRDPRAFQMGINKMKNYSKPLFFKLLTSGPIPKTENLQSYTDVYRRGLLEVDRLLS
ncbi:Qat anti-phage system QueC-like protein QatC [Adhaeribacter soli]|uniref:7-cyano-7-deazaguanine synthase n=1 Tax=Adhaeribacter soli TaxID=2607655 RepID=A0A5N1J137_9BACT|nr:Qat anti-phage system QueC-like protein QatC [Adhaeribacter soli]KAA9340118.1 hypothetical protein F0P94_07155 [Adhaeribacter soli]